MKASIYALLLFLFSTASVSAASNAMQCHIHPPVLKDKTPKLIGPYNNRGLCEQERKTRYGSQGRCHCGFNSPLQPRYSPFGRDERLPRP